jgi:hypothetical protein
MPKAEARIRFLHDGTEYTYSAHHDAAAKSGGNHVEAIDGSNEALCWAMGGMWLSGGPRAILDCLEQRVGRAFDNVGGFIFACEDNDDEATRVPAGHVAFLFFDLPELLISEPFLRRFAGAFGLAALEADAQIGRLQLDPHERALMHAAFAALAAEAGRPQ